MLPVRKKSCVIYRFAGVKRLRTTVLYHKENPHVSAAVTQMRFVGKNSQAITIVCTKGYMQIFEGE